MKLITEDRKKYYLRRIKKADRKRVKKKNLRKERNLTKQKKWNLAHQSLDDSVCITAPTEFTIGEKKGEKLIRFLSKLRLAVLQNDRLTIDFYSTKRMVADGTILLKAELSRVLRLKKGNVHIRCIPPKSNKVAQVLKQIGIYSLLKFESSISLTADDVINWRYADGCGADGEKYDSVLGHYDGEISKELASKLYIGITEAMTNCHNHAYIFPRKDGLNIQNEEKDWWMFSQERDGMLSVVFCDLGAGIPNTLEIRQPQLWRRIQNMLGFGRLGEGDIIKLAIEESRSRTGHRYRGKGLSQLVNAINGIDNATLLIVSNKGYYYISNGVLKAGQYPFSILGTMIFWRVPLPSYIEQQDSIHKDFV